MKQDIINIRILNGKNKTYYFRQALKENGFLFTKKAYGKGFWEKKIIKNDNQSISKYQEFCKNNKLKLEVIYPEFIRNNDYRKNFFEKKKGFISDYYFCSYCGLIFKKDKITIDHIFPVNRISKNKFYQKLLMWLNIKNINDYRNLTCACKHCNSKKGKKMGLWILRGFLGKYNIWWCFVWTMFTIIFIYLLSNIFNFNLMKNIIFK